MLDNTFSSRHFEVYCLCVFLFLFFFLLLLLLFIYLFLAQNGLCHVLQIVFMKWQSLHYRKKKRKISPIYRLMNSPGRGKRVKFPLFNTIFFPTLV